MGTVTLAARTLLAVVFGIAALAKISTPSESRTTFREFGAGEQLSDVGAILLPPTELVVAVTLMIVPTARWAALGAMALLIAFIAGIGNALIQGRRPDCGCFGALRPTPIGISTLVRNVALLVVAGLVAIWGPGPSVDGWLVSRNTASLVTLAILILGVAAVLFYTMRSAVPAGAEAAPPIPTPASPRLSLGDPAPEFSLSGASGEARTLKSLYDEGHPLVLVFVSSGCGSCLKLLADLGRWQATFAGRLRIAVIGIGEAEEMRRVCDGYGIQDVLTGTTDDVQRAYGVLATPGAVAAAPDGTVVSGPVIGQNAIEDLIRLTLRQFNPMCDPWGRTINAA